ncbi:MAG TPA: Hsp33 family molecular chaperone HslO [Blastocatellia bacterium]|nr:Hsp33 family molecular chaperone HslO [Blastocatellia bacterium]
MKTELSNSHSNDHLIQAVAADATVRAIAAVTTGLVDEASKRHGASGTASAALGRALTGALMLGRTFKDLERITLQFRGDGPIGTITAEASAQGTVRGYINNPAADLPPNEQGKLDVAGVIGQGMMHVIREAAYEMGFTKEPYYGSVPLVSGEIAEDIVYYLSVSEQIPSAVSLGVFVGPDEVRDCRVIAAGGFLIQTLPGAGPEMIAAIEASVSRAPHATEMIRQGARAREILQIALGDIPFEVLDERPVEFRCTCSYERAVNIVSCLERDEVEDMLEKDKGAEMTCHFCNEVYWLDEAALEKILAPPLVM